MTALRRTDPSPSFVARPATAGSSSTSFMVSARGASTIRASASKFSLAFQPQNRYKSDMPKAKQIIDSHRALIRAINEAKEAGLNAAWAEKYPHGQWQVQVTIRRPGGRPNVSAAIKHFELHWNPRRDSAFRMVGFHAASHDREGRFTPFNSRCKRAANGCTSYNSRGAFIRGCTRRGVPAELLAFFNTLFAVD